MTDQEIRDTVRQMMTDWNTATPEQREQAVRDAQQERFRAEIQRREAKTDLPSPDTAAAFLGAFLPLVAEDDRFTPGVAPHGAGLAATSCLLISRNLGVMLFGTGYLLQVNALA